MLLGYLLLVLALLSGLFSAFHFLKGGDAYPKTARIAKSLYYLLVFFISAVTFYLFYLFLSHRFEFSYVYAYSSTDLPFFYLLSSFWAGQEGTFLLWLFFGAWLGVFLLKKGDEYESHTMFFYLLVQIFLLILLLKKSPFELVPGFTPDEGRGLNPLLQDFWMVIHPPLIFVGYAALAIPFSYALAALFKNNYKSWLKLALPWTCFGALFLGAGIFVGGYWAYKVLGWGGYWGWDPVENASLIPWIFVLVFLHGMIIQKTDGALRKTNLFLAILIFLLVLYGTFLTRSGVLADFSVHSFTDLGINLYLIIGMIVFIAFSLGLLIWRSPKIKSPKIDRNVLSQGFGVTLGMVFLSVSAILILLGTSSPIITGFLGNPSKVDTVYYIRTNLPLGILIAFTLGMIPFLAWKGSRIAKKILLPVSLTIVLTILALILGVRSLVYLVFICMGIFAFTANLFVFIKRIRKNILTAGGFLAHIGLGILLIGVITSSAYSFSTKVNLPKGEEKEIWGYHLRYQGFEERELRVEVGKEGNKFMAKPKFYYSDYTDGVMRTPHIDYNFWGDLYLAPLEIQTEEKSFVMKKGEGIEFRNYKIRFVEFDMAPHSVGGKMAVGVRLEVLWNEEKQVIVPTLIMGMGGEREQRGAELPGGDGLVYLDVIDADNKAISLSIVDVSEETAETLILEISRKPLIGLVWLGTIFMMIGLGISWWRRKKEAG
jgi:cytochrome c-type biogenesis protein CcmF